MMGRWDCSYAVHVIACHCMSMPGHNEEALRRCEGTEFWLVKCRIHSWQRLQTFQRPKECPRKTLLLAISPVLELPCSTWECFADNSSETLLCKLKRAIHPQSGPWVHAKKHWFLLPLAVFPWNDTSHPFSSPCQHSRSTEADLARLRHVGE